MDAAPGRASAGGSVIGEMQRFDPQDLDFENQVRTSFGKQTFMAKIGAELTRVAPGEVEIALPFRDDLLQQHGYLHGAVIAAIVDSACGYAAQSLMPSGATVLTVEYKVNFLAPALGKRILARGTVLRPGRKLTVCSGECRAGEDGETLVASLLATMIRVTDRPLSK